MIRLASFALALLPGVFLASPLRAENFSIELHGKTAKEPKAAEAKFPGPDGKPQVRAVLTADVQATITVKWTVRNLEPAATPKDVLVHFFVVKQDKPDQQEVPKLTKNVVAESALTMDFRPQDKTDGEIAFAIPTAGCYLVRVELKGITRKDGRESFAALDLVVR